MAHITVNPADEDEVIGAGVGSRQAEELPVQARGAAQMEELQPRNSKPKEVKRSQEDGYRETTLEDLESSGMPFAQRVVIVAAVVCIIGALIYYFVAMR